MQPWIYKDPPPLPSDEDSHTDGSRSYRDEPNLVLPNADRSLGIGEDNVWMDSGRRDE